MKTVTTDEKRKGEVSIVFKLFSRRWEKVIKTAKEESSAVPLLKALC